MSELCSIFEMHSADNEINILFFDSQFSFFVSTLKDLTTLRALGLDVLDWYIKILPGFITPGLTKGIHVRSGGHRSGYLASELQRPYTQCLAEPRSPFDFIRFR